MSAETSTPGKIVALNATDQQISAFIVLINGSRKYVDFFLNRTL